MGVTGTWLWQVVIKYVPYVGDSKRALDEYTSEIMMGGTNTIVIHNTCEVRAGPPACPQGVPGVSPQCRGVPSPPRCPQDSLLASPIILDLAILTELCQRITFCTEADPEFQGFHSVLSILAFLCKAPLVPEGTPVVNALFRQRSCIENILRYPGGPRPRGHQVPPPRCPRWHPKARRGSQCGIARVPGGPSAPRGVPKARGTWSPRPGVLSGGGGSQCHQWVPVPVCAGR